MGVLRIKDHVDDLLEKDPYELFTIDEPHRLGRRLRPEVWGAAGVGVVAALIVTCITFWRAQQDARESNEQPYAYFEIRAIDPDGRPVTGAIVRQGDKQVGITDSFGEWRRFLKVTPGSTVMLQLGKKGPGPALAAVKAIAVPGTLPAGGDLELTGSVQLQAAGAGDPTGGPAANGGLSPHKGAPQTAAEGPAPGLFGWLATKFGFGPNLDARGVAAPRRVVRNAVITRHTTRAAAKHQAGGAATLRAAQAATAWQPPAARANAPAMTPSTQPVPQESTQASTLAATAALAAAGGLDEASGADVDVNSGSLPPSAIGQLDKVRAQSTATSVPANAAPDAPAAGSKAAAPAPQPTVSDVAAAAAAGGAAGAPAAGDAPDFSTVWITCDAQGGALEPLASALKQRSQELGLKVAPESPWRVRLSEIPLGSGQSPLLKVDGLLTEHGQTERIFTFLRNLGDAPVESTREILWTISTRVLKPYRVTRQNGAWYLDDGVPKLWGLAPGRAVFDAAGQAYRVISDSPERRRLAAAETEPCSGAVTCLVTAAGADRAPPVPGWQRLRLKVLGMDQGAAIYVSGYEAHKIQDKLYEYWGAPASAANVTALRGGHLVYRGRIQGGSATLPFISLPSPGLSRK